MPSVLYFAFFHLHNYANGIDTSPVQEQREDAKGFSAETTVEENLEDLEAMNRILLAQADVVTARMRAEEAKCRCVQVSYRTISFQNKSHQRKLPIATDVTEEIYQVATQLIAESWNGEPLRLIGLAITDIDRDCFEQISFLQDERQEKLKKLDFTMDSIRNKFGNASVQRASTMDAQKRVARRYQAQMDIKRDGE